MFRKRKILFLLFIFVLSCYMFVQELSLHDSSENFQDGKMPSERLHKTKHWYLFNSGCKVKHNVLLLKTHKTGSSTVQNILLRYADEHNLTLAFPQPHNYFGHPEPFNRSMIYHSPPSIENNIFAFHARFNYKEMKAVMPSDTIFITVLREPVKLMESLIIYYNLPRTYHIPPSILFMEKFFSATPNATKYHATRTPRLGKRYGRNQMSFDLGMTENSFDDISKVTDFIASIDSQFHLVMIVERMEESLILLQHLLCWSLGDIIAFRQNARLNKSIEHISTDLEERIRYYNKADQLLYEYFSAKLDRQVKEFGEEEMKKQVRSLREVTQSMYEDCVAQTVAKNLNFHPIYARTKVDVVRYQMKLGTNRTCKQLTIDELAYLPELRKKQGENFRIKVPTEKKSILPPNRIHVLDLDNEIIEK